MRYSDLAGTEKERNMMDCMRLNENTGLKLRWKGAKRSRHALVKICNPTEIPLQGQEMQFDFNLETSTKVSQVGG